jgi:predicted DNA binding protein
MYKVELDIYHRGCWGSEINVKFPNHQFSSVDCRWIRGQVVHILLARGNSLKFKKIIEYLKKRKDVLKLETLSEDNQSLYLRVLTKKNKKIGQFSDMFFEHNCFPIAPTKFLNKSEVWTLGTAKKKNITEVYDSLKKKYKTKINYLKEEKPQHNLTKKQREVLTFAKHFGYYEWPRKKSVTEICKMVNIPKTVFLSHLRKAENKIINEYIKIE